MIVTSGLSKSFITDHGEIKALDSMNISIPKGSVVGLLGPNGAGKTTSIRLLSTVYRPSKGTAKLGGYSIDKDALEIRKIIGISPEKPALYDSLSGRRNLRFYAELYDVPKSEINTRIDELAEIFDLEDAIDRPVGGYSRGMKQKVSIAKSIIHEPEILMLDEPWAGLSPVAARDLRQQISNMQKDKERTVLITTHNLAQTEKIADKIIIISHGKVIATGSPNELRSKYNISNLIHIKMEKMNEFAKNLEQEFDYVKLVRTIDSQQLEVEIDSYDHTPEIIKYLIDHGAKLHEVSEVVPSLEDLYLSLVEEG